MTWKEKTKKVSGNQVIDSSITFANLGCTINQDDMASNSDTHLPTQQSVKAYVDALIAQSLDQNAIITTAEYDTSPISLTRFTSIVWTEFDTAAYNEKRMHTARFEIDLIAGSSTYRNEAIFYIYATVPSGITAYSLGIATYESAPEQYGRIISFPGNITDLLSLGGAIGVSLNSVGVFGDRSLEYYYYSVSDNKTYVRYNSYPSDIVSNGSPVEIFFDPFHWATDGTNLIFEQYTIELPYTSQDSVITLKTKLGCAQEAFNYSLRAREINTGDSITIHKIRHELTTQKVSGLLFPVDLSETPTATDAGILLNQNYCGGNYFADDFVGDKRIL